MPKYQIQSLFIVRPSPNTWWKISIIIWFVCHSLHTDSSDISFEHHDWCLIDSYFFITNLLYQLISSKLFLLHKNVSINCSWFTCYRSYFKLNFISWFSVIVSSIHFMSCSILSREYFSVIFELFQLKTKFRLCYWMIKGMISNNWEVTNE